MNKHTLNLSDRGFFAIARSRPVVVNAIKVALFVGTILAVINHGEKIHSMSLSSIDCVKVLFTYLVPYCVSTWSAVGAIKRKTS